MLPPSPSPSAAELARALRALEPRAGALLRRRLVEGQSPSACAALYGVSPAALQIHLLRACRELEAELGAPRSAPPRDEHEEQQQAQRLAEGLSRGAAAPELPVALQLLRLGPRVRSELAAAEEREAASPQRRRGEWLRRLCIALLLGFTAWYLLVR